MGLRTVGLVARRWCLWGAAVAVCVVGVAWSSVPAGATVPGQNGDIAVVDGGAVGDVYRLDPTTGAATRLSSSPEPDGSPSWSPDGARVVFRSIRDPVFVDPSTRAAELYVVNGDGTDEKRLTFNWIDEQLETRIIELRREQKLGPARIGMILDMPASTVWRVLARHGLNRLSWMDRPTGKVIRR